MDVLLATCAAMPGLYADDRYLLEALSQGGSPLRRRYVERDLGQGG
jgi:hypothetical protein